MHPIEHVRRKVLGLNQAALAEIVGVTQPTVSRWENGELEPSRDELVRIRNEVRLRGLPWEDRWFFESPPTSPSEVDVGVAPAPADPTS